LSLCHIRTPFLPVFGALTVLLEPLLLRAEIFVVIDDNHGRWWSRSRPSLLKYRKPKVLLTDWTRKERELFALESSTSFSRIAASWRDDKKPIN
jgi:hypothetical protein